MRGTQTCVVQTCVVQTCVVHRHVWYRHVWYRHMWCRHVWCRHVWYRHVWYRHVWYRHVCTHMLRSLGDWICVDMSTDIRMDICMDISKYTDMHFAAWRLAEERGAPRPHRGKRGPPAHCSMDRRHLAHPPVTKRQVAVANATRLCHGRELRYVLFHQIPRARCNQRYAYARACVCAHDVRTHAMYACTRIRCAHAGMDLSDIANDIWWADFGMWPWYTSHTRTPQTHTVCTHGERTHRMGASMQCMQARMLGRPNARMPEHNVCGTATGTALCMSGHSCQR